MRSFTTVPQARDPKRSRLIIRLIAAERLLRGIVLFVAGIYLVTHSHSDLGRLADRAMRALELDPRRPFLHRLIDKLHHLHAGTVLITGIAAIGYGVLETVEGVGLWLEKLWAEFLTVIATSLLIPLEIYELSRKPSIWKAGGILVNLLIVAYLARRLRKRLAAD
jgi:uncharacterized membrane protein (DUF2068 family)